LHRRLRAPDDHRGIDANADTDGDGLCNPAASSSRDKPDSAMAAGTVTHQWSACTGGFLCHCMLPQPVATTPRRSNR